MKTNVTICILSILLLLLYSCQKEERPWDYNIDINTPPSCSIPSFYPYQVMHQYNDSISSSSTDSMYSYIASPLEYHCSGLYTSGKIQFRIKNTLIFEVQYGTRSNNNDFFGIKTTYNNYTSQNHTEQCLFYQRGGCFTGC